MFRKVKWTFIGITMALLAVVLVVVLLIFNIASYNGQLEGIKTSLTMALDRGPGGMGLPSIGGFAFEQDEDFVVHGLAGSDDAFEADTDADAAAAAGGDDADDAAASGGYVAAGERTTRIAVGDGGMPAPPDGAEPGGMERSSVPVYCVTVDEQLTVLSSNGTAYMEQTVLAQAISLASASPVEFGELGDLSLFYAVRETHDGMRIAFASSSDLHAQAADRALGSALIGACVLAVLFAISYFLARFAMRPVEEAWAGQRRFIADASHELKTPLTVILANTDIVCSDPESTVGEQERWLEGTREEAKKMQGLVQDLLTLAQTEPDAVQAGNAGGELERIDFSELVEGDVLQFEAVAFERGIAIEGEVAEGVFVRADRDRLARVVRVLLDNACKYSQVAGPDGREGTLVSVRLAAEKSHAVLSVNNGGAPIPPDDLPHVFDRFYRSDKARTGKSGGFGLGLPIAQNIVNAAGGQISVASNASDGTTFTVRLPLA